jgi:hypothetical protein
MELVFDDRFQAESGWNWFLMTASKQSQDGTLSSNTGMNLTSAEYTVENS